MRITRSAAGAFSKSGYHSTSLSEIAASAGMRAPSLLYHFPSKKVLFDEVIRHAYRKLEEELTPLFTSTVSPREILLRLFERLIAIEEHNHGLVYLLNAELLSPDQHGAAAIGDTMMPLLKRFGDQLRAASGHRSHRDAPARQAPLHIAAVTIEPPGCSSGLSQVPLAGHVGVVVSVLQERR
jgi:AcrR family transcriptional regulator